MEIRGFEPLTPGLQSRCSSQLSYIPSHRFRHRERKKADAVLKHARADSILTHTGYARTLRVPLPLEKEVIQPHLPVRLPCYDFTPLTKRTFDSVPLAVGLPASGTPCSDGVTGGVYKARERIHRAVLMCGY